MVELIASGDHAGGAEEFVDTVALGPGTWAAMPPQAQQTLINNAPTFLDEARDPEQLFPKPAFLTLGDQSLPLFAPVVEKLAQALPNVEVRAFRGAGHIPHVTHPDAYAQAIVAFARKHAR